jgi:hypothetical protein
MGLKSPIDSRNLITCESPPNEITCSISLQRNSPAGHNARWPDCNVHTSPPVVESSSVYPAIRVQREDEAAAYA